MDIYPTTPWRTEATEPSGYRLGLRGGNFVLQGCFRWSDGLRCGHEWRDLPTVDLDAEGVKA